ncbi:hypothetical protein EX30DRAFT_343026 [Ascodesmis nigricans]|uniref:Uncharacterized protein n=1 Tax=Ascodesmis nigricans TaxID=341454 RepID=A0A4S2MND7_9PEZI|nr:hypothetical protein EX30DRAFT_343026 [Ascodesmis nigricans]
MLTPNTNVSTSSNLRLQTPSSSLHAKEKNRKSIVVYQEKTNTEKKTRHTHGQNQSSSKKSHAKTWDYLSPFAFMMHCQILCSSFFLLFRPSDGLTGRPSPASV